ncbi:MAG TPA: hypothetical protein VFG10_12295 [Saprospiraceae bacterium]|nr:hypothetical protein [Saprospiraceae bacterium]
MKSILSIVFLIALCSTCMNMICAQTIVQPKQLDYSSVGILYSEERAIELRPHTNGAAIAMQFGKIVTFYKTHYYQFDFGLVRHPKEFRQSITFHSGNPFTRTSNSFTFGKQNNLMVLRGGVGQKVYFSDKAKRKGVAVGVNYEFGASIGLLKPYYLHLSRLLDDGFTDYVSTERYSEDNADIFLDDSKIIGPASFFKGFDKISVVPGLHARLGAHFSMGAFDEYVKAFEIGFMVDGFFRRVPIMIIENNTPVFINGYLSFQLGKRR